LVGSEAVRFYAPRTDVVVGIDNDLRARFFGPEASTGWNVEALKTRFANYRHQTVEIAGRELDWTYTDDSRVGDHIWYVSGQVQVALPRLVVVLRRRGDPGRHLPASREPVAVSSPRG
jgi:hypothetical protein